MLFELQPRLQSHLIRLEPLEPDDFDALFAVASDPLIWEQHPNPDRYQRAVFSTYFQGALASGGASRIIDQATGQLIGSSRYYDYDPGRRVICVGYTFIARSAWGRHYNRALKTLMLNHAFRWVDRVIFHVGARNHRSRKAMEKLGGRLAGEMQVSYHGEIPSANVVYHIDKADWQNGL